MVTAGAVAGASQQPRAASAKRAPDKDDPPCLPSSNIIKDSSTHKRYRIGNLLGKVSDRLILVMTKRDDGGICSPPQQLQVVLLSHYYWDDCSGADDARPLGSRSVRSVWLRDRRIHVQGTGFIPNPDAIAIFTSIAVRSARLPERAIFTLLKSCPGLVINLWHQFRNFPSVSHLD